MRPLARRTRRAVALAALVFLAVGVVGAVAIAATVFPHGLLMLAFVLLAGPLAWPRVLRRGAARWRSLATAALLIAGALALGAGHGPCRVRRSGSRCRPQAHRRMRSSS
jgi:hypothetical protein